MLSGLQNLSSNLGSQEKIINKGNNNGNNDRNMSNNSFPTPKSSDTGNITSNHSNNGNVSNNSFPTPKSSDTGNITSNHSNLSNNFNGSNNSSNKDAVALLSSSNNNSHNNGFSADHSFSGVEFAAAVQSSSLISKAPNFDTVSLIFPVLAGYLQSEVTVRSYVNELKRLVIKHRVSL
jgi:hypothetical protein